MNQTNRIPGGFLDLLGAETGGKTPPYYDNKVSPQVGMDELYRAQTLSQYVANVTHGASFQEVRFLVPNNEYWLLRAFNFQSGSLGSTNEFEGWALQVKELPRGNSGPITTSSSSIAWLFGRCQLANTNVADAVSFANPILLTPGVEVAIVNVQRDAVLGPKTTTVALTFNKLRAGA